MRRTANDLAFKFLPKLGKTAHKGQHGKIAIVGGCFEYTGAPYYAAISSLKAGGDLGFILSSPEAATAIKSYSPELIVLPVMRTHTETSEETSVVLDKLRKSMKTWLPKFDSLVVGPGMGRDYLMMSCAASIIKEAKLLEKPLVIDADGIQLICEDPNLIKGYKKAILTPNIAEFHRLCNAIIPDIPKDDRSAIALSQALDHVTIIQKGAIDIISSGYKDLGWEIGEGYVTTRRCGGQGDILSGMCGLMMHFAHKFDQKSDDGTLLSTTERSEVAAAYASLYTKRAAVVTALEKVSPSVLFYHKFIQWMSSSAIINLYKEFSPKTHK
eukprot:TRINITY_DN5898_c0_g2_i2.p1 TRINITY_DN5898_c0_g2~~TRINITY_DN5898_c0_g2_i2.p1  ORF type:complete len:327 (+),score=67.13 TRINITY_DN5898_c0_g2_i2:77-1057(+)